MMNDYQQILKETIDGIERGYSHAHAAWRQMALEIVFESCLTYEKFSANVVTEKIKKSPIKTHDNRAIAGVMATARKWKWLAHSGETEISKAGHLTRVQIWKSLLYNRPERQAIHTDFLQSRRVSEERKGQPATLFS